MTKTITEYQPLIYSTLLRRNAARLEREERVIRALNVATSVTLSLAAVGWLGWSGWFIFHALFLQP